jgi:hypothetical protein
MGFASLKANADTLAFAVVPRDPTLEQISARKFRQFVLCIELILSPLRLRMTQRIGSIARSFHLF